MPIYKHKAKADLNVVIRANKRLKKNPSAKILLLLEQHINDLGIITLQLPEDGLQCDCNLRLHIRDFIS